jgi:hypothetical protein
MLKPPSLHNIHSKLQGIYFINLSHTLKTKIQQNYNDLFTVLSASQLGLGLALQPFPMPILQTDLAWRQLPSTAQTPGNQRTLLST